MRTPSRGFRVFASALGVTGAVLLFGSPGALAHNPDQLDDSAVQGSSTKFGQGHGPEIGARTIDHWSGTATVRAQTFTYSMAGADPSTGAAATVEVDIVPIDVRVGGMAFRGSDVVDQVIASPLFQALDYTSTVAASSRTMGMGAGGDLSAGNTGVQLLDATMRSQFNMVGTGYHLYLSPSAVHRPVTIAVPASAGVPLSSPRGITYADIDEAWMESTVEGLTTGLHYLEPHRLTLFLTKDVVLYGNHVPSMCCVFGAHGVTDVTAEGNGSDGRQALQTFVWSSWMTAGFFSPSRAWARQDINGLSHELVEWASDPFMTNVVPSWRSPIAPQYGCNNLLETGDPVVGVGFSIGTNTFVDPADPSYSASRPHGWGDGTYHPEDEVFLPWFFGQAPNTTSQPTQGASANGGRYTFMGDLNQYSFFHEPATGC